MKIRRNSDEIKESYDSYEGIYKIELKGSEMHEAFYTGWREQMAVMIADALWEKVIFAGKEKEFASDWASRCGDAWAKDLVNSKPLQQCIKSTINEFMYELLNEKLPAECHIDPGTMERISEEKE